MKHRRATFQHYLEYAAWLTITGAVRLLPRRAVVLTADAIGWLMYKVFRVRRKLVDEQISLALGGKRSAIELRRIGLRSWQNTVLTFFEFLAPRAAAVAAVEGEEFLRQVMPGPVIVITGHLGNWEDMSSYAKQVGVQIAAVGKPMHNPLVNDSIAAGRARRGVEIIEVKASMKRLVDATRAGKWIAILGDQDARRAGIFVPFFGRPASTAVGPAHFAWKLNQPLFPAYCVHMDDPLRSLKVVMMAPIYPDSTVPRDAEIQRLTLAHVQALEEAVRRYPENYFWLHRRWKTKPRPEKSGNAQIEVAQQRIETAE